MSAKIRRLNERDINIKSHAQGSRLLVVLEKLGKRSINIISQDQGQRSGHKGCIV